MTRTLYVAVLMLICGMLWTGAPCRAGTAALSDADLLKAISHGVKFYRTTHRVAALSISYSERLHGKIELPAQGPGSPGKFVIEYGKDMPDRSKCQEIWVQKANCKYISVDLLGNLNADRGDDQSFQVGGKIVWGPSGIDKLDTYRLRKKEPVTPRAQHPSSPCSGSAAPAERIVTRFMNNGDSMLSRAVFPDGMWQEYYDLDPRYWMYYVDDTPLDKRLADSRWRATIVGQEVLYGSHCAVVQALYSAGSQGVDRIRCWVDLDHQYIIRKTEDTLLSAPGGGTVDQVLLRSSIPSLLRINGYWYCRSFSSITSLPLTPKVRATPSNSSKVVWFRKVSAQIARMSGRPAWVSASCKMKWPTGATVYDHATDKTFLVRADGSLAMRR